jgi:hypothetical protein
VVGDPLVSRPFSTGTSPGPAPGFEVAKKANVLEITDENEKMTPLGK